MDLPVELPVELPVGHTTTPRPARALSQPPGAYALMGSWVLSHSLHMAFSAVGNPLSGPLQLVSDEIIRQYRLMLIHHNKRERAAAGSNSGE